LQELAKCAWSALMVGCCSSSLRLVGLEIAPRNLALKAGCSLCEKGAHHPLFGSSRGCGTHGSRCDLLAGCLVSFEACQRAVSGRLHLASYVVKPPAPSKLAASGHAPPHLRLITHRHKQYRCLGRSLPASWWCRR
jgi:hypothetical protein